MKSPAKVIGKSRFYEGDCISGAIEHLEDNSVDLIITDPPYGIDGDKLHQHYNRDESFVVDGYIEIPISQYDQFSREWIGQAHRVLKPGGTIYIVSGYTHLHAVLAGLKATPLREINHIIWKYNFGVFTKRKYVSSHYHILYYEKPGGRRTFNLESRYGLNESNEDSGGSSNYRDREDVWVINREYKPGERKNKNELPTALLEKMLVYSSNEGDLVCDLFMGGFSTACVAIELGRRFVGFELSKSAFEHGIGRVLETKPGCRLAGLHVADSTQPKNAGAPWTPQDIESLAASYRSLRSSGLKKNEATRQLCTMLGRGHWSITKALKSLESSNRLPDAPTLFSSESG